MSQDQNHLLSARSGYQMATLMTSLTWRRRKRMVELRAGQTQKAFPVEIGARRRRTCGVDDARTVAGVVVDSAAVRNVTPLVEHLPKLPSRLWTVKWLRYVMVT